MKEFYNAMTLLALAAIVILTLAVSKLHEDVQSLQYRVKLLEGIQRTIGIQPDGLLRHKPTYYKWILQHYGKRRTF